MGVPTETLLNKVGEVRVFIADDKREGLAHRLAQLATRVLAHDRLDMGPICGFREEFVLATGLGEDLGVGNVNHFHQAGHLIVLAVTREDWVADVELSHDAAERPHVNGRVVGDPKHDLRCSIEATLNVSVDALIEEG